MPYMHACTTGNEFAVHLSPLTVHRSPSSFTSHLSPLTSSGPSTSPRTGGKGWSLRLHSPFRLSPLTSHFSPPPAPRLPPNRRQRLEPSLTVAVPPLTSHLSLLTSSGPPPPREPEAKAGAFAYIRLSPLTSHLSPPPAPQPPREPEAKAGAFAYIRRSASHFSLLTSSGLSPLAS